MRLLSFVIGPALECNSPKTGTRRLLVSIGPLFYSAAKLVPLAFLVGGLNLLVAQHGGGHGGGGHMSSGHVSSFSGGHSHGEPAATTYSTLSNHYPSPGQTVYPTPIGLQPQYSGYTGINRGVLPTGNYGRGNRRSGYGYRGGYFYPYYVSTFDDYDTPFAYNNYSGEDPGAQNAEMTANSLGEQIAELSAEVDALRNERELPNSLPYSPAARPPYNAPPPAAEDETPSAAPLTLILHDGKTVQMKNYAVMGQNIWDFSTQPAKRIALASVDLSASKTATEANGGEFPELR